MRITLVIGIALLLLLVGCGGQGVERSTAYNFKQGITEVEFRVLPNAPPEQIYPDSDFKIIVEVDNQAAYDALDVEVHIVGINDYYFLVDQMPQQVPLLAGRSALAPAGEKTFVEFDGRSQDLFQNAEEYNTLFFVNGRYTSRMDFVDSLCINQNLYAVYDAGCEVEARKAYAGQGAPLAVTDVEEINSREGVEFRLHLKNRGNGKATFATLEGATLGGKDIDCEFQRSVDTKTIQFEEGKQEAVAICKSAARSAQSYVTTLAVRFVYGYEVRQEQRLRLVR